MMCLKAPERRVAYYRGVILDVKQAFLWAALRGYSLRYVDVYPDDDAASISVTLARHEASQRDGDVLKKMLMYGLHHYLIRVDAGGGEITVTVKEAGREKTALLLHALAKAVREVFSPERGPAAGDALCLDAAGVNTDKLYSAFRWIELAGYRLYAARYGDYSGTCPHFINVKLAKIVRSEENNEEECGEREDCEEERVNIDEAFELGERDGEEFAKMVAGALADTKISMVSSDMAWRGDKMFVVADVELVSGTCLDVAAFTHALARTFLDA